MTQYKVADGYNNAVGLALLNPQPAAPSMLKHAELAYAADGSAYPYGYLQTTLVWNTLTRTEYNTILTAFGLSLTVKANEVTVSVLKNDNTYANANAIAVLLDEEQRIPTSQYVRDVRILLNKIEFL